MPAGKETGVPQTRRVPKCKWQGLKLYQLDMKRTEGRKMGKWEESNPTNLRGKHYGKINMLLS